MEKHNFPQNKAIKDVTAPCCCAVPYIIGCSTIAGRTCAKSSVLSRLWRYFTQIMYRVSSELFKATETGSNVTIDSPTLPAAGRWVMWWVRSSLHLWNCGFNLRKLRRFILLYICQWVKQRIFFNEKKLLKTMWEGKKKRQRQIVCVKRLLSMKRSWGKRAQVWLCRKSKGKYCTKPLLMPGDQQYLLVGGFPAMLQRDECFFCFVFYLHGGPAHNGMYLLEEN